MQQHITTGCEDLDHILRGGIHCGEVTEVGNFAIYLTLHVWTHIREKKGDNCKNGLVYSEVPSFFVFCV